jgi:hypothetical protein
MVVDLHHKLLHLIRHLAVRFLGALYVCVTTSFKNRFHL